MEQPTNWRTSSRSKSGGNCVEVGHVSDGAAVRDTKDRDAGFFTATSSQWSAFVDAIKANRFDS